jgi:hypothetical protein
VSFLYSRLASCIGAITIACSVIFSMNALGATAGTSCPVLGNSERTRLLEYVKKKYKLSPTASLTVSRESFVGATCFRKLEFKSSDPKRSFLVELFLSPDFRFLARELLDSSVDPILEERRKQQALANGFTTGNFPSLGPKDARITARESFFKESLVCRGRWASMTASADRRRATKG